MLVQRRCFFFYISDYPTHVAYIRTTVRTSTVINQTAIITIIQYCVISISSDSETQAPFRQRQSTLVRHKSKKNEEEELRRRRPRTYLELLHACSSYREKRSKKTEGGKSSQRNFCRHKHRRRAERGKEEEEKKLSPFWAHITANFSGLFFFSLSFSSSRCFSAVSIYALAFFPSPNELPDRTFPHSRCSKSRGSAFLN